MACMVEVLYSKPEPDGGEQHEMTVLPHHMMKEDADQLYEVTKLDECSNSSWADLIKPADDLSDPGPDGKLEFVPAMSKDGALLVRDEAEEAQGRMARQKAWSTTSKYIIYLNLKVY